jgi:hypothetical protein
MPIDYNKIPRSTLDYAGFPQAPANPPRPFMPMTPQYEAMRRGASDQLSAAQSGVRTSLMQVQPQLQQGLARLGTDRAYASRSLDEDLAERGMFTSGIRSDLQTRDVAIPFGRQEQDMGAAAAAQYADLYSQLMGAGLGYNQTLMEGLLDRASQLYENPTLSTPQYGYNLPAQPGFEGPNEPDRPGRPERSQPRRDRPRRRPRDRDRNRNDRRGR